MKDVTTLRHLLATTAAYFGLPQPAGSALRPAAEPPADYSGRRKSATPIVATASSLSSLAADLRAAGAPLPPAQAGFFRPSISFLNSPQ